MRSAEQIEDNDKIPVTVTMEQKKRNLLMEDMLKPCEWLLKMVVENSKSCLVRLSPKKQHVE